MSAKSRGNRGRLSKKEQAKQQNAIIYGMGFVLLLGMALGFFIQSQSSSSVPVDVDVTQGGNTEVVAFVQPGSHSVLEGALSMHGEVVSVDGTTLTFIDDNGDRQTITQDDAANFYEGQIMHFNYDLNDDGSISPIPNTAGGH